MSGACHLHQSLLKSQLPDDEDSDVSPRIHDRLPSANVQGVRMGGLPPRGGCALEELNVEKEYEPLPEGLVSASTGARK